MASDKSRRETLLIGLGLIGVAAGWQLWVRRPRRFEFSEIPGLPGWRRLKGGQVSSGATGAVFAGLGDSEPVVPLDPTRLCDVLFGRATQTGVPVAIFTDVNCPYCRQVAPSLAARAVEGRITLHWLEWPIYGPPSEQAAEALTAAEQLGEADALRGPLYAGPSQPLSRVVAQSGIAPAQLRDRMASAPVATRLNEIDRAAQLLRLPGTPSMMIGRTLVTGALPPAELDRLIALEADLGPPPCA